MSNLSVLLRNIVLVLQEQQTSLKCPGIFFCVIIQLFKSGTCLLCYDGSIKVQIDENGVVVKLSLKVAVTRNQICIA